MPSDTYDEAADLRDRIASSLSARFQSDLQDIQKCCPQCYRQYQRWVNVVYVDGLRNGFCPKGIKAFDQYLEWYWDYCST